MSKKIRFPLEMDNGVEVRSVEELRDNFSIARVIGYVKDGKLITWLRDRYANDLADAVEQLDQADIELAKRVSDIFDVPYDETLEQDLEKVTERIERLKRLKEFTDEQKYQDVVDQVAFDQDGLYDLLDEDVTEIYLCGERFDIPLAKPGITYIGINQPIAIIDSKVEVDWKEKNISLVGMIFDDKYQAILSKSIADESKLSTDNDKGVDDINTFEEKAIVLFTEIVNQKRQDSFLSHHNFSLIGYNAECLIYLETWKIMIRGTQYAYYRYFRDTKKEERIEVAYQTVHCCVHKNKLFTIVESGNIADKSELFVENLNGTGRKRLLTREYTYGIATKALIENGIIYVYYYKPGDKNDVWKSAWYDLKNNHDWEKLYDDSVGIYTL